MWYSILENTIVPRNILHQHWDTLQVRRNSQHRSLSHFRTSVSTPSSVKLLPPRLNRYTRQTLPTVNRKHFFKNILCIESFCLQKMHNRTLLFGSKAFKHGRHFEYWNKLMNMRMRVFYLDYHVAELCCYLVIQIENLLRPLQLFYFHLRLIYWLPRIKINLSLQKAKEDGRSINTESSFCVLLVWHEALNVSSHSAADVRFKDIMIGLLELFW
jgi:hypothetical protein